MKNDNLISLKKPGEKKGKNQDNTEAGKRKIFYQLKGHESGTQPLQFLGIVNCQIFNVFVSHRKLHSADR